MLENIFGIFYLYADSAAFLLLSALGLIIIMGMMGIINMAHGELIMLGAYISVITYRIGLPLPVAIIIATISVGLIGMVLERFIIRRFYGNLRISLVATWGISLILSQGMLILFGPSLPGVATPFGGFTVAGKSYSTYRLVLAGLAILILVLVWLLFNYTKFGMKARATMQKPEIAESLGVKSSTMNLLTFGLGSALAGLAGALYAPTTVITPLFGQSFLAPAFVTVVVSGGADVIAGALYTSVSLGVIQGTCSAIFNTFVGRLSLFVATIIIIRVLPTGISGYIARMAQKKGAKV